jgi:hypothetical protein
MTWVLSGHPNTTITQAARQYGNILWQKAQFPFGKAAIKPKSLSPM